MMDTNAVLSAYTAPRVPALFPRSARQIGSHGRRRRRRRRQGRPLACADRLANLWKQLTALYFNDGGPAFCRTHCGQRANQNRRHLANFRRNGKTDCGATVTNLLAAELLKHLKEKARLLSHHAGAQISAEQWASRMPGPTRNIAERRTYWQLHDPSEEVFEHSPVPFNFTQMGTAIFTTSGSIA